jgi:hypothetical protein
MVSPNVQASSTRCSTAHTLLSAPKDLPLALAESSPPSATPSLPPEILFKIIGHLEPYKHILDRQTLASCCLVCKSLLKPACDILYRQVTVIFRSSHRTEDERERRLSQTLVNVEDTGDDEISFVAWGLAGGSSAKAALADPLLGAHAHIVEFNLASYADPAPLELDWAVEEWLEDTEGEAVEKSAAEFVQKVLQACRLVSGVCMMDGLPSAIQGIAYSLRTHSTNITRLDIEISDSWDFKRPAAPFAALCQSLPSLKHLRIGVLAIEPTDWEAFDMPVYRLETASLWCSPHAYNFFLGASAPSLKSLDLSSALPDRPLDLSCFAALEEVELCCQYYDSTTSG